MAECKACLGFGYDPYRPLQDCYGCDGTGVELTPEEKEINRLNWLLSVQRENVNILLEHLRFIVESVDKTKLTINPSELKATMADIRCDAERAHRAMLDYHAPFTLVPKQLEIGLPD